MGGRVWCVIRFNYLVGNIKGEIWILNMGGPRSITVNSELIKSGKVYVDPQGFCVFEEKRSSDRR